MAQSRATTGSSPLHSSAWKYLFLFPGIFLVFFLLTSRAVVVFDEGVLLTCVMRVLDGQVIHRDFYYNYGPAQLYLLAAVFKLFGPSVLAERLVALTTSTCLATTIYVLTRRLCSRSVAAAATIVCMIWMIGIGLTLSVLMSSVCLLILWSTWLILPVFQRTLPTRTALAAGLLVGLATLFRYDTGVALAMAHILTILLAICLRQRGLRSQLRSACSSLWPYLAAAAAVVAPPAIAYLSVAPLHDFLFDVVLYNAKYYRAGRGLPFPPLGFGPRFQDVVVYVLPVLLGLSLYAFIRWLVVRHRSGDTHAGIPLWISSLCAFTVAAAVMYPKGLIRVGAGQMYGAILPCVLLAAVLYQHRLSLRTPARVLLAAALTLFIATGAAAAKNDLFNGRHMKPVLARWIVSPARRAHRPPYDQWCAIGNPVTRGICFLVDNDHIQAVQYLDAHTRPADTLYVGLPHHDRIFINDNITYFAAQRLPATRWTQFDPFLENSADIQQQMISDLERNRPPYVALDSEFEGMGEPNGSSVSTGVHLLDDYIAAHYTPVQRYGEMTIFKRDR
jgi:hypothetical protein